MRYILILLFFSSLLNSQEIDLTKEHPKIKSFLYRGNPDKFEYLYISQQSAAPWLCTKCGIRNHASQHRCRSCGSKKG